MEIHLPNLANSNYKLFTSQESVLHTNTENNNPKYRYCRFCRYASSHAGNFKKHVTSQHPETQLHENTNFNAIYNGSRPLNGLTTHMRAYQFKKESKKKKLLCTVCGQPFNHVSNLNNHEFRVHKISHPFPCKFCFRRFKSDRGRNRHVLYAHVHPKIHVCKDCNHIFPRGRNLKQHLLTRKHLKNACEKHNHPETQLYGATNFSTTLNASSIEPSRQRSGVSGILKIKSRSREQWALPKTPKTREIWRGWE